MRLEFATAARIVFGPGTLKETGAIAREFGKRALVVTGGNTNRARPLTDLLNTSGVATGCFAVPGEPATDLIEKGVQLARETGCDLVIAFGGGSAIDAAKAIAGLVTNQAPMLDYLEIIGEGKPLVHPALPCIVLPTTAGTGAEVTKNAVLASPSHRVKVSLRSPFLLPRVAIVDPDLTHDLPPAITASTGLDALTQLIEPYVSVRANPMTDALCREGLLRVSRSLRRAFENGRDADAREDMALASLFGGLALANAGLGAVHGFASPIGGMFPAPHGAVCAALLPHVMQANVRALQERDPDSEKLRRYDEVARILTGNSAATATDGIGWVVALCAVLGIQPLRAYGITWDDLPLIVERSAKASSMKGNPIALTSAELGDILSRAF